MARSPVRSLPTLAYSMAAEEPWRRPSTLNPAGLDDWTASRVDDFGDREPDMVAMCEGNALVHNALTPCDLVVCQDRWLCVLGWRHSHLFPPWVDLASFAVLLIEHGHHPDEAEEIVTHNPVWATTNPAAITAHAVQTYGMWELRRILRAARALGREQSSVQKQLDNLNRAATRLVGEALVIKQGRGKDFLFTPSGEEVVALARQGLLSWTDSCTAAHDRRRATDDQTATPGRPRHARQQRRDLRAHRPHRTVRAGLVPLGRHTGVARDDAGDSDWRRARARGMGGPFGTPIGQVLDLAATTPHAQAVLTGGVAGAWLPLPSAAAVRFSPEDLAAAGGTAGTGAIHVLGERMCGLAETARIVRYLAGESAAQCGPCMFGLPSMADDLTRIAEGTADPGLPARLEHRLAVVEGRGACRHPDGAVRVARSALRVFTEDLRRHLAGRPCRHAVEEGRR